MIPNIAIITGAGWKPFNETNTSDPDIVPHRVPDLLWPLGDGHTVLSRLAAQFHGVKIKQVIAGVGAPGSSPKAVEDYQQGIWNTDYLEGYKKPVWTQERIDYIESLKVQPALMDDPHARGKTCWTTLIPILEALLKQDGWERLVVCAGDYIFKTAYLHKLIGDAVYSSQVWLWPKHSVEFLNRRGAQIFLAYLAEIDTHDQSKVYQQRNLLHRQGVVIVESQPKNRDIAWKELSRYWCEVGTRVRAMHQFVASDPIEGVV